MVSQLGGITTLANKAKGKIGEGVAKLVGAPEIPEEGKPPTPATPGEPAAADRATKARLMMRARQGRASTILTGGSLGNYNQGSNTLGG
jgi:hypothetical protein